MLLATYMTEHEELLRLRREIEEKEGIIKKQNSQRRIFRLRRKMSGLKNRMLRLMLRKSRLKT